MVSCDNSNGGCEGGLGNNALNYIYENEAIMGAAYPYVSGVTGYDGTCTSGTKTSYDLLSSPGYDKVTTSYLGLKTAMLD